MLFPLSIPSPTVSFFDVSAWLKTLGIALPFPLVIHFYALCILLGIVLATVITSRRLTLRGGEPGIVLDIVLWTVPLGILGARIFHVLTHPADYFYPGADLARVFFIWEGGIAIFGSLLGGAVGAFIGCRITGIRFWSFVDALAPGLLLAQAFGRLGNYFNQELYGTPTTLPWGLEIYQPNAAFPLGLEKNTLFHPTFLYEMIWNLLGVLLILWIEKRLRLQWGKVLAVYLIWYGVGRSFFESIRIDPSEIFWGVRTNIWVAWLAILIGIILFIVQTRRTHGMECTAYRSGIPWSEPSEENPKNQVESKQKNAEVESDDSRVSEPTR